MVFMQFVLHSLPSRLVTFCTFAYVDLQASKRHQQALKVAYFTTNNLHYKRHFVHEDRHKKKLFLAIVCVFRTTTKNFMHELSSLEHVRFREFFAQDRISRQLSFSRDSISRASTTASYIRTWMCGSFLKIEPFGGLEGQFPSIYLFLDIRNQPNYLAFYSPKNRNSRLHYRIIILNKIALHC
jgi:hypothetical protein